MATEPKFDWQLRGGIWYMHDVTGMILASVRQDHAKTFKAAFYGHSPVFYLELDQAKTAMAELAKSGELARENAASMKKQKEDDKHG